jgi:hypothetical protein
MGNNIGLDLSAWHSFELLGLLNTDRALGGIIF